MADIIGSSVDVSFHYSYSKSAFSFIVSMYLHLRSVCDKALQQLQFSNIHSQSQDSGCLMIFTDFSKCTTEP